MDCVLCLFLVYIPEISNFSNVLNFVFFLDFGLPYILVLGDSVSFAFFTCNVLLVSSGYVGVWTGVAFSFIIGPFLKAMTFASVSLMIHFVSCLLFNSLLQYSHLFP